MPPCRWWVCLQQSFRVIELIIYFVIMVCQRFVAPHRRDTEKHRQAGSTSHIDPPSSSQDWLSRILAHSVQPLGGITVQSSESLSSYLHVFGLCLW